MMVRQPVGGIWFAVGGRLGGERSCVVEVSSRGVRLPLGAVDRVIRIFDRRGEFVWDYFPNGDPPPLCQVRVRAF
jgi:uncharacterized protein (DUF2384 family)